MTLLAFSSLLGTRGVIQSKMLETVAVHHTFVAFIKSSLLRRPQAPPYHSAPPDRCEEIILLFKNNNFLRIESSFRTQAKPEIF